MNKVNKPLAENGFTINRDDVVGFPCIGCSLFACSSFIKAFAKAVGFLMILAPVSSARYSLARDIANWIIIAIMGVRMPRASKAIAFPASRSLLPAKAANLSINAM